MIHFPQDFFARLYGDEQNIRETQNARYNALAEQWYKRFGNTAAPETDRAQALRFFSSPGRSEIGGNHTDHNLGKVLAASIRQDSIAAVQVSDDNLIYVYDLCYNEDYSIDTGDTGCKAGEKGSAALIRGIVQGFKDRGYAVGGFKGCFTSDVIAAAGVSSSASFEMLICLILNNLFNGGRIPQEELPAIGQFAENRYWNKKSGLLDQTACAAGGLVAIDFKNPERPLIEKIPFDFDKENYALMIVNTGSGHADLSEEYSAIPAEMHAVAASLGKSRLRSVNFETVYEHLSDIRKNCGDRAVMRAFHFFEENERVDKEIAVLKSGDFTGFLKLIEESGNSSWKYLQNICVSGNHTEQPIAVCLALTEHFLRQKACGACRVHGGGFAGVIQTFIPRSLCAEYTAYMEKALGFTPSADKKSPVFLMGIRPVGAVEVFARFP